MKKKSNKVVRKTRLKSLVSTGRLVYMYEQEQQSETLQAPAPPPPPPPPEEVVQKLNEIGKEYPFCVSFHEKMNDPL
jgi:hypothetical protein